MSKSRSNKRSHSANSFSVCIAVSSYTDLNDALTQSLERALVTQWPAREQLKLLHTSIDDALSLKSQCASATSCMLVCVCDPSMSADEINRLLTRVRALDKASIVLCEEARIGEVTCSHPNVLLLPTTTQADNLAHALLGTHTGQALAEGVMAELAIVQSSTSGAYKQMEQVNEEMQLAGQIQQELMPRELPDVPGVDIGVMFQPVGYVSGDVYGVREISPGVVWFFLADAVGHGMPAALLSVLICRAMNKDADTAIAGKSENLDSPASRLAHLNQELASAGAGRGRFATGIAGTFDTHTNTLTIACAGHPPALLAIKKDGAQRHASCEAGGMEEIDATGPMLGVFTNAEYDDVTLTIEPGQSLLIYSDGFETAFPDDEQAATVQRRGSREYVDHFANLPWPTNTDGRVQNALDALTTLVGANAGSLHQADDLTALVIAPTRCADAKAVNKAAA